MGITVELQDLGDAQLCREITAHVERVFSNREGVRKVSITGSRASETWVLRIQRPKGFERSYSLASSSGEHEPEVIGKLVLKLPEV